MSVAKEYNLCTFMLKAKYFALGQTKLLFVFLKTGACKNAGHGKSYLSPAYILSLLVIYRI